MAFVWSVIRMQNKVITATLYAKCVINIAVIIPRQGQGETLNSMSSENNSRRRRMADQTLE